MTLWLSTRWTVTGRSAEKVAPRSIGRKPATARLPLHRLEIEARRGGTDRPRRARCSQPCSSTGWRRARAKHDIIILAGRRLDRVPAIAGALGLVDDERADRAAPRRLLELVGPAAIIGHRPAAEPAGDRLARRRLEIGIVDQEDGDLAVQIDVAEIVPLRSGAVTP